jgi:hypothetical protein
VTATTLGNRKESLVLEDSCKKEGIKIKKQLCSAYSVAVTRKIKMAFSAVTFSAGPWPSSPLFLVGFGFPENVRVETDPLFPLFLNKKKPPNYFGCCFFRN